MTGFLYANVFTFFWFILLTSDITLYILNKKNMKRFYLVFLGVLILSLAYGQDTHVTYKVTNYAVNGENYDDVALQGDVSLSFYKCDSETICFSNHWRNSDSQSYGAVYALQTKEFPETEEQYRILDFKFTWHFFNSYDDISGQAVVTISNIYIGNTIKFVAEIVVLDTNEVISLKGYLE